MFETTPTPERPIWEINPDTAGNHIGFHIKRRGATAFSPADHFGVIRGLDEEGLVRIALYQDDDTWLYTRIAPADLAKDWIYD